MASAKQKAAARRNIKKAQAALKRKRGGRSSTRRKKRTASRRAPVRSSPRRSPPRRKTGMAQKNVMSGFIAGAISPFARMALGPFGNGATALSVGMFQRDTTLQTIGSLQLGEALASGLSLGGNGGGGLL